MGGRHVGEEADEESENQLRRLEAGDWAKLENAVANSWRRTPTIEFMYGLKLKFFKHVNGRWWAKGNWLKEF